MARPSIRHRRLTVELLEDRITPTISFTGFSGVGSTVSTARGVAVGDLSGNGINDIAVGGVGGVNIFMGDGKGNFKLTSSVSGIADIYQLFLVDLTGNGKLDLVGIYSDDGAGSQIYVAMGNGNGTFQHPITWFEQYTIASMAVGDLNGEGLPDFVASTPGRIAVFLNDGSGRLFNSPTFYSFGNPATDVVGGVVVGDFNGNGHPDIAVGDITGNSVDVFPNNGDGRFENPTIYNNPVQGGTVDLVTGDFNNDGKLDLIAVYGGSTDIGLYIGNGNGTFQTPELINTTIEATPVATTAYLAADFDKDGSLDLAFTGGFDGQSGLYIFPGNGDGTFGEPISLVNGGGYTLTTGDFTGDGLPDLADVYDGSPGLLNIALNTTRYTTLSSFNVSAPTTVNVGQLIHVTLTAQNAIGATLTGYTGTVNFSSADQQAGFPASLHFTRSDRGVVQLEIRATKPEILSISVDDSIDASAAGKTSVRVNPSSVNGDNSTMLIADTTDNSGTTDQVTIVLEDRSGNPVTGLISPDFQFTLSGGTSTGIIGPVTETSTPGTYTANFTGMTAGTPKMLELKVNGVQLAAQPTIQVTAGAVNGTKTIVHQTSPTVPSGKTDLIAFAVKDAVGNPISGLSNDDFEVDLSGGASTGSFGSVTEAATPGLYTVEFTGFAAGTASVLIVAIDDVQLTTKLELTVKPGSVNGSTSSASFTTSTVGSETTDKVSITVKDAAGNLVTRLPSSVFAFKLAGGTSTGKLSAVIPTSTPGTYIAIFTGILAGSASTLEVEVDGMELDTQPAVQVTPGAANGTKSTDSFATPTVAAANTDTLTMTVKDTAGNAITGLTNSDFVFGLFGGTSTGSFGTVTETQTPGTYTVAFTGEFAGTTTTLSIEVSEVLLGTKSKVTVTA
jgi:hypothetical protein